MNCNVGFPAKHFTNHALIDITENVKSALDNKIHACGIFVDLQKAFNTVNHKILLEKMSHYWHQEVLQMIGPHLIYQIIINMFPF